MVLLHPLAVHFPLALWLTSALFDLLACRGEDRLYPSAAYWLVGLGLLGAVLSIALGWIDLLVQERAGIGTGLVLRHRLHSEAAYIATLVYAMNLGWRWRTQNRVSATLLTLSLAGAMWQEHSPLHAIRDARRASISGRTLLSTSRPTLISNRGGAPG